MEDGGVKGGGGGCPSCSREGEGLEEEEEGGEGSGSELVVDGDILICPQRDEGERGGGKTRADGQL